MIIDFFSLVGGLPSGAPGRISLATPVIPLDASISLPVSGQVSTALHVVD
jgi:hypothetical protein